MTPAERELARDIAVLDFLTPDQLLQETGLAERWAAEGRETDEDLAYRAELEKRAHQITKEIEMDICGRVGCECCPTSAYCQTPATTAGGAAVRYPGLSSETGRVCDRCAADLQALQARIDRSV